MIYSDIAIIAFSIAVMVDLFIFKTSMLTRPAFWTSYAIILPFQFLTNWWLTSRNIVMYDPNAIIVFFLISMKIFKALGESGQWLFVDTWIFTGTALATFGMSRGYVEFWLVWVAVDLVGVPFAFKNGYYPTGTLYAIYLPFVIWGFISWLKISKKEKESV